MREPSARQLSTTSPVSRLRHMEIRIEFPDELAATLQRTQEELEYDLRLRSLAGLVERGLLSSGRAAEIAGVSRREFLDWCGRWHIRIHRWDDAEIAAELAYARAGTLESLIKRRSEHFACGELPADLRGGKDVDAVVGASATSL